MANQKPGIEILNEGSAVGLLLLIYREKEIYSVDLRKVPGGYDRLKRLADTMRDMGIVEIETKEKPYLTHIYSLTQKGSMIAEKLKEIEEIITS